MPYSNNRIFITEPFFFYDVKVTVNHDGEVRDYVLVDPVEILKTKQIFVIFH